LDKIVESNTAGNTATTGIPHEAPCYVSALKAPFPWFGGKSRAADIVWKHFGDVPNYVEPFAGSLAVLLGRPTKPRTETVNDEDCYLSNFWRALSADPEQVAFFADWPVNEADLHARHKWLLAQSDFRERMKVDPNFYDAKIAGWWVWGLCSWIGQGWCYAERAQRPHLGHGMGINRKFPHLGDAGRDLAGYFEQLALRLRKVRVVCGDWSRVLGPCVTIYHGITGVFLDPPYASNRNISYAVDSRTVAHKVREWAIANGDNPLMRIALCGYDGEHVMPEGWAVVAWKACGGYGLHGNGKGRDNSVKERIWFSPRCLHPVRQLGLF